RWRGWAFLKAGQFGPAGGDFTPPILINPGSQNAHPGRGEAGPGAGGKGPGREGIRPARGEDRGGEAARRGGEKPVRPTPLQKHFAPVPLDDLVVSLRHFPYRIRPDLQRAIDGLLSEMKLCHFCAPRYAQAGMPIHQGMSELLVRVPHNPITPGPAEYDDLD